MAKVPPFEVESHPKGKDLDYFADRVSKFARDLKTILVKLTFGDNFFQYTWEGLIPAATEIEIPHPLKRIPSGLLVLSNDEGYICRGDALWTTDKISVKNKAALSDANVKLSILG